MRSSQNKRKHKKSLAFQMLEKISEGSISAVALFGSIFISPYGSSESILEKNFENIKESLEIDFFDAKIKSSKKQQYYNLIHRLREDNLICEFRSNGKKFFKLSKKGRLLVKNLKKENLLPKSNLYKKEDGNCYILVIFDIPEKERAKRNWLREVLKNLDFNMEQKSVWIGKTKIPKDLINDLLDLGLGGYVKISEITKKGNLESII